jgi:hypothetical protein
MNATTQIFARLRRIAQREVPDLRVDLFLGTASDYPRARDFAACGLSQGRIFILVAPKMLNQPAARQEGLLRHELAHAVLVHRGIEHTEAECDAEAERLFGDPLYYDAEDVQTIDPKAPRARRPRPSYLPRGDEHDPVRSFHSPKPENRMAKANPQQAPLQNPIGKKFNADVQIVRMPHGTRRHIKHPHPGTATLCCPHLETKAREYSIIPVTDQDVTVDCYRCLKLAAYNQQLRGNPLNVGTASELGLRAKGRKV